MILNKQERGLPDWPYLSQVGPQDYVVEGKHISYRRLLLVRRLLKLAAIVFFIYLVKVLVQRAEYWQYGVLRWMGYFMAYIFLGLFFPLPRLLCWLFFRNVTRVRFTPAEIVVNGKRYPLEPHLAIGFRANRAPATDLECADEHPRDAEYLRRFRVIDMIYGISVVPIATVPYEFRAEQFAVLLQNAFERSQRRAARREGRVVMEDALPE